MISTQLDQLAVSRSRLEASIASADSYVERLRKRVEEDDEQSEEAVSRGQREPATTSTTSTEVPATPQ
ncbi:MAG: hypothetical protein WKF84_17610 [Pyrinomonadaceae bacterium]